MQGLKKRAMASLAMLCCVVSIYASAASGITVMVNGHALSGAPQAIMVNGSVMLPFRAVFHALGVSDSQITWNAAQRSIEVRTSDEKYIFLVVGSRGALVDEKMLTLPVAAFVQNGSTYVPVRFVAEALGASVRWDPASKTVHITK